MNPAPNRAGFERAGDPMGAGSGISVLRAVAVGGQRIRVVFSSEPNHATASGVDDGRNPALYSLEIISGAGKELQCVGVVPDVVSWPAYGLVADGEYALDVQADRPVVVGLTYRITVKPALRSAAGDLIGYPYAAEFVGAARPARVRQLRRRVGLVDLASDPFAGGITVDSAGDWGSHEGLPATSKRIWRIAFTGKGKFIWLKNFGLVYDIKKPATQSILTGLRTDLKQQIAQQPDVKSSETEVLMNARGFLELNIKAKTVDGQIDERVAATENGIVS
jgi:hypothetical protein